MEEKRWIICAGPWPKGKGSLFLKQTPEGAPIETTADPREARRFRHKEAADVEHARLKGELAAKTAQDDWRLIGEINVRDLAQP